jgi:small subunit ribosomal protein S15
MIFAPEPETTDSPTIASDSGKSETKEETKMALSKIKTKEVVKEFGMKEGDSGSPEVQIALLTKEIELLNAHLLVHKHDFHSKRGLQMKVVHRRSLLDYLQSISNDRYVAVLDKLGLRK